MSRIARSALLGATLAGALALTGCADDPQGPARTVPAVQVLASFYPLEYAAAQVGGDLVEVSSLTPPGAEPHDVELSPRQLRTVGEADVVVYLAGFQAAVDEAVAAREPEHVVDAAAIPAVAAHMPRAAGRDQHEGHEDEQAGQHHEGADPHFWLDPTLLAAVGHDIAQALGEADPAHAEDYRGRAEALATELAALDDAFATGLAECQGDVFVTAHAAFGYLAERYGLEQVGIAGIEPETEPSPARLREIRAVVAEHDVTTIFTEVLINPKVSETLAADLGVRTAVLDPVESQADTATDYRGAMDANLAALREALRCT
jgi:zinc transport system substrate-binding protein